MKAFSFIAISLGLFTSSSALASVNNQDIQNPFDLVCWQFTELARIEKATDADNLVAYSFKKKSFEPTDIQKHFKNPTVECLKDRGQITLNRSRANGEMTWTETIETDVTGAAKMVSFSSSGMDINATGSYKFGGDGLNALTVNRKFVAGRTVFPEDKWQNIDSFLAGEYKFFECTMSEGEIKNSGGTSVVGVNSTVYESQSSFNLKENGKYSFTEKRAKRAEVTYELNNGVLIPCYVKEDVEILATNKTLP